MFTLKLLTDEQNAGLKPYDVSVSFAKTFTSNCATDS